MDVIKINDDGDDDDDDDDDVMQNQKLKNYLYSNDLY